MTEISPERSALLLSDARRFAGIKTPAWPEELHPEQLAALMAGGFRGDKSADYKKWRGRITDAMNGGALVARMEQPPPVVLQRDARNLPDWVAFRKALIPVSDGVRTRLVYSETHTPPPIHFIGTSTCATWLHAIDERPNEYVRAWLGPAWNENVPKVGADDTAPADDSRPSERMAFWRTLWVKFDKPGTNAEMWREVKKSAGTKGYPVTSVTGDEFVFRYSDGTTERLLKTRFGKDMTVVRGA